jgi:hypothetical protein
MISPLSKFLYGQFIYHYTMLLQSFQSPREILVGGMRHASPRNVKNIPDSDLTDLEATIHAPRISKIGKFDL